MIKNIVFDIGNVLVDFGWKKFIEKFGYSEDIQNRIIAATVKSGAWNEYDRGVLTDEEIVQGFINNDPGIETQLREMCEDFNGLLTQFEYAKGWIKDLQNKGFKVYALSNMSYKATRECADALNFLPMLDGYILSCDVKCIKPDKKIYDLLLEKYKLTASECVFFDDTMPNVEAAVSYGWHAICFKDLKQAVSELEALVKKESEGAKFESKYSKPQRIAALVCVILIVLMYLFTLILSLLKAPWAKTLFRVSLGCTLVLPLLAWIYIWMYGKLTHKDTIADFHFFEK